MKENEWTSIDDALPKLGQDVLIKSLTRWNGEYTAQLNKESFCGTDVLIFRGCTFVYMPTHWRYPVEKRPDFSKLRKGDLVIIICDNNRDPKVGYISKVGNYDIYTSRYADTAGTSNISSGFFGNSFSEIKKITRINFEEKTFEEI